jgi:hypothetical protein
VEVTGERSLQQSIGVKVDSFMELPKVAVNTCLEDYYATIYSAEIVNTLTNLLFIALGTKGLINSLKYNHDTVFKVAFVGYLLVGSGSFLFHSTLKCQFIKTETCFYAYLGRSDAISR